MRELWRQFEGRIKQETLIAGGVITHIPSHIQKTRNGFHRQKTDCDFALAFDGRAAFLDAKSANDKKFYFSDHHTFDQKKIHQYRFLIEAHAKGSKAGYLVWLYGVDRIIWIPVHVVMRAERDKEKFIDHTTADVVSQSSNEPINLRTLIWG